MSIPTPKQLNKMIEQQEVFAKQVQLTLALMRAYRMDPHNLTFIGAEIKKKCNFDENYLDESMDEIACEAAYHNVGLTPAGGIFEVINIVPKKQRKTLDELIEFVNTHEFKNI